ncbi:MAG: aminoacyl-tRNA hydrolase [Patescibacteria group bacterium]
MILIVGLGNPGKKYDLTRHNLGKTIVKNFAKSFDFPKFKIDKKLKSEISKNNIDNQEIILALPITYMNESGQSLKKLIINYHLSLINLWVIHDDIDLPLGKIRISKNRSSAGHKGVQSIIDYLGTQDFVRFRIGIQTATSKNLSSEKFVLQKFTKNEQKIVQKVIQLTVNALEFAIKNGLEKTMNKYN